MARAIPRNHIDGRRISIGVTASAKSWPNTTGTSGGPKIASPTTATAPRRLQLRIASPVRFCRSTPSSLATRGSMLPAKPRATMVTVSATDWATA